MNTNNPLQPQGTLPKENKNKTNIRIAVFTILAVHVVLLLGLLMQGCKREETKKEAKESSLQNTGLPPLPAETPYTSTNLPAPEATAAAGLPTATPPTPTVAEPGFPTVPAPVGPTTEY